VELIRRENGDTRPILAIMDNVPTHKATMVRESCERLGIGRTFLPPYSPDLNPIEFGWKDAKRAELDTRVRQDGTGEQTHRAQAVRGKEERLRRSLDPLVPANNVDRMTISSCRSAESSLAAGTGRIRKRR